MLKFVESLSNEQIPLSAGSKVVMWEIKVKQVSLFLINSSLFSRKIIKSSMATV